MQIYLLKNNGIDTRREQNIFNLFTLVFLRPGFLSDTVLVKMQVRN